MDEGLPFSVGILIEPDLSILLFETADVSQLSFDLSFELSVQLFDILPLIFQLLTTNCLLIELSRFIPEAAVKPLDFCRQHLESTLVLFSSR
jgi:hypothetical protein